MSGQELVNGQPAPSVCLLAVCGVGLSSGGVVLPLCADMVCDVLCRGPRPGLRGGAGHVRKGGLIYQLPGASSWQGADRSAAALAYLSAATFPSIPTWEGTQRMVTWSPRAWMRSQTSMAATAKRWAGPKASVLTRSMAAVESAKMVNRPPAPWSSIQSSAVEVFGESDRRRYVAHAAFGCRGTQIGRAHV